MAHQFTYNAETKIIELKVQGNFGAANKDIIVGLIKKIKDLDCFLVLIDLREARLIFSLPELFTLPLYIKTELEKEGMSFEKVKRAIVAEPDEPNLRFAENVALTRGHHMRVFINVNEAQLWLLQIKP